ncbi:MAG: enoyl-CoA hydratase/isomerase family protein [Desulfobacteraceae bacterium]|nr:enoyl-CoA hydratase/isomerase family protein [Desulfobacteraceae bacterium]
MAYENLTYEKKDRIALVTINRPPANSWSMAAMEDFEQILDEIENDQDIRVVILTGTGEKCFSAGMDVADAGKSPGIGDRGRKLWRRVDRFEKPTIAAINGHALGGGLELALSCHFRIMADSPKSKIGLTELNLGIIPGWGGTQRLYRIVGKAKALDMILFSKRLNAREALEIGLVNQISAPETLMADTFEFAELIAKRPPLAVSGVLKAISAGIYEGLDQGLVMESEGSKIVAGSEDAIEGFTAFFEKREPVFKGK